MSFKDRVQRFAGAFSRERHLLALRDGMASIIPLIIIGSVFTLIGNFPVPAFTKWLTQIGMADFFAKASNSTFGIIGMLVAFTVSYRLADSYHVEPLSAGLISLGAYILVTPVWHLKVGDAFPYQYFGTQGMFVALIVALISTEIYRALYQRHIVIKMPDTVPPNVSNAFTAIIPGFVVIFFWFIVNIILNKCGITNPHQIIQQLLAKPLQNAVDTLPGTLLIIGLECFFWMFGIHGANVMSPIVDPILYSNSNINRLAYQAGKPLPKIVTYEFLYNYVFTGGAGSVFALALLVFLCSRSKEDKALGKMAMAPLCFQVAEPILFGFPTILNIRMVIPFCLAPISSAIITYFGMAWGLVARPVGAVIPWTTPPVIAGFLASGGRISGAVISIITIAVNVLIYYPFFRSEDNRKLRAEQAKAKQEKQAGAQA